MAILAQRKPVFQQAMRIIQSITNAHQAVVTTTFAHQYITGMIVRLNVPAGYGMVQVNQLYGPIVVTGDTTFTIDIDTTFFDPFLSLINVGTTNGSGSLSGNVTGNSIPFSLSQNFSIGSEYYQIIVASGPMFSNSTGSGTFVLSSGAFTFSGALASTPVFFNQVVYPDSAQWAQVTTVGEVSSMLTSATRNVLPYSAV